MLCRTLLGLTLLIAPSAPAQVQWFRGPGPGARASHAMAFDSLRQRVVLFGGTNQGGDSDETWEWDGAAWNQSFPAVSPGARHSHEMAYDRARGRVVLFGGRSFGVSALDDTWEWDGIRWTNVAPAQKPSARVGHAVVYDAGRQRCVLFGGWTTPPSAGVDLADTWEYDGSAWVQRTLPSSPSARSGHAMAYDSTRALVVLFGGGQVGNTNPKNDTWEYDGLTWTPRSPASAPAPQTGARLAFDVARACTVLFGSGAETWLWDGQAWSLATPNAPPVPVSESALCYDSVHARTFLFGGFDALHYASARGYAWDGSQWTEAGPLHPDEMPSPAFTYDPGNGGLLLFGGGNPFAYPRGGWLLVSGAWQRFPAAALTTPGASVAATDLARGRVVRFGGQIATVEHDETWEWDGRSWLQLSPAQRPPVRQRHAMAYDEARKSVVMFGGLWALYQDLDDTWEWDGAAWTQVPTAHRPGPRHDAAMCYDRERARVVLFGGVRAFVPNAETWEDDGSDWVQRFPTTAPAARAGHRLAYDGVHRRCVLAGGGSTNTSSYRDVWEWDGTSWSKVALPEIPGRQSILAADPLRGTVTLFDTGGTAWEYRTATPPSSEPFGAGCAGTLGVLGLAARLGSHAVPGSTLVLEAGPLRSAAPAFLTLGASRSASLGLVLPFDLTVAGMPGCQLLASADVAVYALAGSSGLAAYPLAIPNDAGLVGRAFYAQAFAPDAGANSLGWIASNGVDARCGN